MALNLNPAIAKDLQNGNIVCHVCSTQVKSKVWTAHVNGRKHRESVQKLKEKAVAKVQPVKRQLSEEDDAPSPSSSPKRFRDGDNGTHVQTPWQAEAAQRQASNSASAPSGKKVIKGVPEGFFDDRALNNRVEDTIEKKKVLDDEYEKFMKEVAEAEVQKEEEDEEAVESMARETELAHIDEQIERWQAVNDLEKKKEELVEMARSKQAPNFAEMDVDGESSDDEDFDLNNVDWRTKIL